MSTNLELVETEELDTANQNFRLKFRLSGPERVVIFLRSTNGSEITDFSFSTSLPTIVSDFQDVPLYFIYIGHGKVNLPYDFFIDVKVDEINLLFRGVLSLCRLSFCDSQKANPNHSSISLTTVGHYTHYDEYQTAEFQNFISSFPAWAHVTPWMCSYTSYLF